MAEFPIPQSEDLEEVVNPSGNEKLWSVGDIILARQDKVRNFIAIIMMISWVILTIILIGMSVSGRCGTNGSNCNPIVYSAFSLLIGVVVSFYFFK